MLSSLKPTSLTEHLAFYELYPGTSQGEKAKAKIIELINRHREEPIGTLSPFSLPPFDIELIIRLVNRKPFTPPPPLSEEQLDTIAQLSSHLHHHLLKGHQLWTLRDFETLDKSEVDLARALLLWQYPDDPLAVRRYEAILDLMALQILAQLPKGASGEAQVRAISNFIFYEMGFRFPPNSLVSKEIDLYTFLPSVIDSRRGVCLGVSILTLVLAQRVGLDLTIITPPGHIFLRYKERNIETTARGIHINDEAYLSINTYRLYERSIKEVIGLAFVNQAAVAWQNKEPTQTVRLYEAARPYLASDPLFKMLLGLSYLTLHRKDEGYALLKEIAHVPFPDAVAPNTIPEDILSGKGSAEAIEVIFSEVDETKGSIRKKQAALQEVIRKYPKFRAAHFHLAITYLQLGRQKEALEIFKTCATLSPDDPEVNYYLTLLCLNRFEYKNAWKYLERTKKILAAKGHKPKALTALEHALRACYPLDTT